MAEQQAAQQSKFGASGARKTMLSFAFILLLPFFVSLPAMLISRIRHGLWQDTVGLGVLALAFAAIMAILLLQLMFAIRARVDLGEKAVGLTLPKGQGPTPKLRYHKKKIPYDQIAAVETRREIYGAPLAPVLLRGARIVTHDGDRISLGYVNDHDVDTFPVMTVAQTIARRAGLDVKDQGAVHRSVSRKAMDSVGLSDAPEEDTPITDAQLAQANAQHRRMMLGVITVMALMLAAGIGMDIVNR